jgi:hypothetical protein
MVAGNDVADVNNKKNTQNVMMTENLYKVC